MFGAFAEGFADFLFGVVTEYDQAIAKCREDIGSMLSKVASLHKNLVYKNIYNNLTYIYKSKGTEKSFRNLLHCFGIDENLVKINVYSNNSFSKLSDNLKDTTRKHYLGAFTLRQLDDMIGHRIPAIGRRLAGCLRLGRKSKFSSQRSLLPRFEPWKRVR